MRNNQVGIQVLYDVSIYSMLYLFFYLFAPHSGPVFFLHLSSKFFILQSNSGLPNFLLTMLCCSHNQVHKSFLLSVLSMKKINNTIVRIYECNIHVISQSPHVRRVFKNTHTTAYQYLLHG